MARMWAVTSVGVRHITRLEHICGWYNDALKKGGVMTMLATRLAAPTAAALIDNNLHTKRRELADPASKTPDALREALKALVEPITGRGASGSDSFTDRFRKGCCWR